MYPVTPSTRRTLALVVFIVLGSFSAKEVAASRSVIRHQELSAAASSSTATKEERFELAEYLVQRSPEEADSLVQILSSELVMNADSVDWARWKYVAAAAQRWQGNYTTALDHYADLYRHHRHCKDSVGLSRSGRFIGTLQMYVGNNVSAQQHLIEAAEIYERTGTARQQASISNSLASFYLNIDQEEKALDSYQKALNRFEALKDSAGMASSNGNIGRVYTRLHRYDEAEIHLQRSLSYCSVFPTGRELAFVHDFMGSLRLAQGRLEEAYDEHLIALRLREGLSSTYNLCESKINTGEVLMALGRHAEAIEMVGDVLDYAEHRSISQQQLAHELLAAAYEAIGDDASALREYKAYKAISDSLYSKESIEVIAEKDAQYRQKEKDAEIALLSKEQQLAKAELGRSRVLLWGGTFALLVFSTLLILLLRVNGKVKSRNELIKSTLKEKNLLLHEIHHRVKNNLQIISSILSLQSRYIHDPAALDAIKDGRNRVQSMAILHKNLYQEDDITGVNMQTYFSNLVQGIFTSYDLTRDQVKLELDIHNINIDVDTVIPIGLITNELITNSLKHAFSAGEGESQIKVMLKETIGQYELIVADNGRGMSDAEMEEQGEETFGSKMIKAFVDKLRAKMDIDNSSGTRVSILIPKIASV